MSSDTIMQLCKVKLWGEKIKYIIYQYMLNIIVFYKNAYRLRKISII